MTNLIKNKKLTRITALLLAVAVIFGTMFTLPVSAASGDKVTITFDYCYDSAGNIIRYKQTTVSDGYTVGTPGEELCKIFADGKEAYCIEPGHTLYSGNTLTEDGSTVWKNLGSAKQKAINLALLYGKRHCAAVISPPITCNQSCSALRQTRFRKKLKRNRGSEMGGNTADCMGICFWLQKYC
ncbi:thioester domain-containing protein [Eubacterium sp. OM08-24]|jgi:hypothetical protein|uniref:thioester domain-containing protein n=1 Tax=Eubacterium sp. OM08-24 TaxID=2292352 RepID=UPI001FA91198|nr:thioester domain-containing protein [Eubacterium sp. OM08-24]